MAHKFITFDIATAIKNAGYPQNYGEGTWYFTEEGKQHIYDSELYPYYGEVYCVDPTYLDVWLWLWREKEIYIDIESSPENIIIAQGWDKNFDELLHICSLFKDPEEVIEKAIEYLIKNDLIK